MWTYKRKDIIMITFILDALKNKVSLRKRNFFGWKCQVLGKAPLDLLNRSQIIRWVMWHDNSKDTVLRRSAQLLMGDENEHFEVRTGEFLHFSDKLVFLYNVMHSVSCTNIYSISVFVTANVDKLWSRHAFEVLILGTHEELCEPPQHSIFRISMSHDTLDDFGAIENV